ncbi:MAG: hypothetical protein LBH92_06770 [Bacteroidales bacterium]|nr:hypothetical protein [Bacteroidales bacterium]
MKGIIRHEGRYYISDEAEQPVVCYMTLDRKHWSIENHLHWQLELLLKKTHV